MQEFAPLCQSDQILKRHQVHFNILTRVEALPRHFFSVQGKETMQCIGLEGRVWIKFSNLYHAGGRVACFLQQFPFCSLGWVFAIFHNTTWKFEQSFANSMPVLSYQHHLTLLRQC